MKKFIKNYFMAIVAVMMVVGFSAFKLAESKSTKVETVKKQSDDPELFDWRYQSNNPAEVTDPTKYDKKVILDPPCVGDSIVCEISAPEGEPGHPDLDAHVDPDDPNSPTYRDLIQQAMTTPKTTNAVVKSFRE